MVEVLNDILNKDKGLILNGTIVLGQDQDIISGGFEETEALRGHLAQIAIYDKVLSGEDVLELSQCQSLNYQLLFSSDMQEIELFGVTTDMVPDDYFCDVKREIIVFPDTPTIHDVLDICKRTGGTNFLPMNVDENRRLHGLLKYRYTVGHYAREIGISVRRLRNTSVWNDMVNNVTFNHDFFKPEKCLNCNIECVYLRFTSENWLTMPCSKKSSNLGAACIYKEPNNLRLRGLCFEKEYKSKLKVQAYEDGVPYFYTYFGIIISRKQNGIWHMFDATSQELLAVIDLPVDVIYPVGRHRWKVESSSLCQGSRGELYPISITSCSSSMFTCDNGDCIPKSQLCDSMTQCQDGSDEELCQLLQIPQSYQKQWPSDVQAATEVQTTVQIIRVLDINDEEHWLQFEIEVVLRWVDDRLEYKNLQYAIQKNKLTAEEMENIWVPTFHFYPVYDGKSELISSDIHVARNGDQFTTDFNNHREGERYVFL